MKDSSQTLTPEESFNLIGKFISNYKENYQSDSFYFLLWGWVISLASLSHFIIIETLISLEKFQLINWLSFANWFLFITAGFLLLFFHIRKNPQETAIRSHLDKFITVLWQTFGWAFILITLISLKLGEYPTPFILLLAGIATFINGVLIKFKPLKYGGIIFFLFAVGATFVTNQYQLLLNAVAIVAGYIIPGYLLRNSKM